MSVLIHLKMKTGRRLNSDAIIADAKCTRVCLYMSVVLLVSSVAYELTRMPYVDAAGTLGLAWFSFGEGRECFEKANNLNHCSC
jgi:divalent metal cation (Fe/Co/Zn/Cd) transporter